MKLTDFASVQLVRVPLSARDKLGAIRELVDLIAAAGLTTDRDQLLSAVQERELQRSTGIGRGFAIPHAKCDAVERLVVAIGRPATPIDFAAIDGKPVQLIALLASPARAITQHIQALARLSRLVTTPALWERLLAADSANELFRVISENDSEG